MKLSTKSTYGLRAMVNIAYNSKRGATSIMDIAKAEGISVSYLEQLLNRLRHEGLVESIRGPKGGYVLSKAADKITVGDVVKTLEKDVAPVHCITTKSSSKNGCERSKICVTKDVWERLAKSIADCLNSVTLADLCKKAKR